MARGGAARGGGRSGHRVSGGLLGRWGPGALGREAARDPGGSRVLHRVRTCGRAERTAEPGPGRARAARSRDAEAGPGGCHPQGGTRAGRRDRAPWGHGRSLGAGVESEGGAPRSGQARKAGALGRPRREWGEVGGRGARGLGLPFWRSRGGRPGPREGHPGSPGEAPPAVGEAAPVAARGGERKGCPGRRRALTTGGPPGCTPNCPAPRRCPAWQVLRRRPLCSPTARPPSRRPEPPRWPGCFSCRGSSCCQPPPLSPGTPQRQQPQLEPPPPGLPPHGPDPSPACWLCPLHPLGPVVPPWGFQSRGRTHTHPFSRS